MLTACISKGRNKVLRLLVFACFFNFSGLNNGYTYLAEVSPLHVNQSVSLAGTVARGFWCVLAPQQVLFSMRQSFGLVTRLALNMESAVKSSWKADLKAASPSPIKTVLRAQNFSSPFAYKAGTAISPKQESYIKEEKESWIKLGQVWSGGELLRTVRAFGKWDALQGLTRRLGESFLDGGERARKTLFSQRVHYSGEADAFARIRFDGMRFPDSFSKNRVFLLEEVSA